MAGCAFYIQDGGKGVCKSGTGRGLTVRQRGMRANPSPALLSPTGAQQGAPWRTVTAWRITNGLLGNVRYCRCANGLLPPPQPFLSLREQMLVALRASCSSPTGGGGRTASVRAVVPAVASARWGKPHPTTMVFYSHPPKASYCVAPLRRTNAYCLQRRALSETFGGWLYIQGSGEDVCKCPMPRRGTSGVRAFAARR